MIALRFRWAGLLLLPALVACGCGGSKTGAISGKVTYGGQPLQMGTVTFYSIEDRGNAKNGTIRPDGSYTVEGVPVGTAQVTVVSTKPIGAEGGEQPAGNESAGRIGGGKEGSFFSLAGKGRKWIEIPAKYGDAGTSELSVKVTGGDQKYDISLAP
jgi:hypothetical protein